jgi:hypothetical protein
MRVDKRVGAGKHKQKHDFGGATLTFRFSLVTFLLALPARQASRFGPVAEIALALLGVRLDDAVAAGFRRVVLAGIHGPIVAIWALVSFIVAYCSL